MRPFETFLLSGKQAEKAHLKYYRKKKYGLRLYAGTVLPPPVYFLHFSVITFISGHAPKRKGTVPPIPVDT